MPHHRHDLTQRRVTHSTPKAGPLNPPIYTITESCVYNLASNKRLRQSFKQLAPYDSFSSLRPRGDVRGGHRVELLRAACEFVPGTEDAAGHGGGDHGPWLDNTRTAVVSCAAVSLGTAEAAWTSFRGPAAPDRTMACVTTVHCGATLLSAPLCLQIRLSSHFTC